MLIHNGLQHSCHPPFSPATITFYVHINSYLIQKRLDVLTQTPKCFVSNVPTFLCWDVLLHTPPHNYISPRRMKFSPMAGVARRWQMSYNHLSTVSQYINSRWQECKEFRPNSCRKPIYSLSAKPDYRIPSIPSFPKHHPEEHQSTYPLQTTKAKT